MAYVYIIYSKQIDKYYIGSCIKLEERINEHLNKKFIDSFTAKANDWILFHKIEGLEYSQARNIEKHIKEMKSRKYIENLKRFEGINETLKERYK